MHLKLVVNNRVEPIINNGTEKTCRSHCTFFDLRTQKCGIFDLIDGDDPEIPGRCQRFSDWKNEDQFPKSEVYELIEDDYIVEFDDEDFLFEIMGDRSHCNYTNYPLKSDIESGRDDAIWYVSPDQTFGCWIINKYSKRFVSVNSNVEVEQGWNKKIYKSPYPLHDHKSSVPLRSRMAWYIDETGWGQYILLINGKIEMLSSPKPSDWEK